MLAAEFRTYVCESRHVWLIACRACGVSVRVTPVCSNSRESVVSLQRPMDLSRKMGWFLVIALLCGAQLALCLPEMQHRSLGSRPSDSGTETLAPVFQNRSKIEVQTAHKRLAPKTPTRVSCIGSRTPSMHWLKQAKQTGVHQRHRIQSPWDP